MNSPRNVWRRWGLLGALGAVALALTSAFSREDTDGTVAPSVAGPAVRAASKSAAAAEGIEPIRNAQLARTRMQVTTADMFRAKSWYVAPPPPPPAPPPAPTAPPLPFTFIGKILNTEGTLTYVLSGHDRVYLVSEGATIEKRYHVDGVKNGKLVLTYLPLHKRQYITLGDAP